MYALWVNVTYLREDPIIRQKPESRAEKTPTDGPILDAGFYALQGIYALQGTCALQGIRRHDSNFTFGALSKRHSAMCRNLIPETQWRVKRKLKKVQQTFSQTYICALYTRRHKKT